MAGLPKSYIKKYGISKKAWRMYRASKSKSKSKTRKITKRKGSVRKTAKRSNILGTAFKFLRLGSFIAPALIKYKNLSGAVSPMKAVGGTLAQYGGMKYGAGDELEFDGATLMRAWLPYLMTSVMTYGIPKLNGIMRRL